MGGLETIALAVSHLERMQQAENDEARRSGLKVMNDVVAETETTTKVASENLSFLAPSMPIRCGFGQVEVPRIVSMDEESGNSSSSSSVSVGNDNGNPSCPYEAPPAEVSSDTHDNTKHSIKASTVDQSGQATSAEKKANDDTISESTRLESLMAAEMRQTEPPPDTPSASEVITSVLKNDVLSGRGGETNHHAGNIQYRQLVKICQPAYIAAKRRDKPKIAASIVRVVRRLGGRFLKKDTKSLSWKDVGNTKAREKTSQALREGAPELRGTRQQKSACSNGFNSVNPSIPTQQNTTIFYHQSAANQYLVGEFHGLSSFEQQSAKRQKTGSPASQVPGFPKTIYSDNDPASPVSIAHDINNVSPAPCGDAIPCSKPVLVRASTGNVSAGPRLKQLLKRRLSVDC